MTTIDQLSEELRNLGLAVQQANPENPSAEDVATITRHISQLWEKAGQLQAEYCLRSAEKLRQREETIRILEEKLEARPAIEPVPAPPSKPNQQKEQTDEAKDEPNSSPQASSLADVLERKQLTDLRKAFSLNDRFRYRKELFDGDEARMNAVLDDLNRLDSHDKILEYIHEILDDKKDNPALADFIKLLEKRKI